MIRIDDPVALSQLIAQAGDRLRCTFVRAPLDYDRPDRADIQIAVMRLTAGTPANRRGALFFNPGGPGEDGLPWALRLLKTFGDSNPANPQGARQLQLLNEYDMVGFSPRGTGASTQITCGGNELNRIVAMSAAEWDTPANRADLHYNAQKTAEACLKNPITPYINSDATARDMDLMRGLMGDAKLNYLGISYGTWLGAWYASLFPQNVGRMVLDSAVDFTDSLEASGLNMPPARQRLLDEVLAPYAAKHAAHFQLGSSVAEVKTTLTNFSPRIQEILAQRLSNLGYMRNDADQYLGIISAARGLNTVLNAAPNLTDINALQIAVTQYVFDSSNPVRNDAIKQAALSFLQAYHDQWIQPVQSGINLNAPTATLMAVRCNDTPAIRDLTTWENTVRSLAQSFPLFFQTAFLFHPCTFWSEPSVTKPDWAAMRSLNVLFVQSQFDTATNTDGADNFFSQLPVARRVYVAGDYQHGVYPNTDTCVDPLVTNYFLGVNPAQRETICPALPLDEDAKLLPPNTTLSSVYLNPQGTGELLKELKQELIPPSDELTNLPPIP